MSCKKSIGAFLSYYAPYKRLLLADLFCSAAAGALALMLPMCVRYITKNVLESGQTDVLSEILRMGLIMVAMIAAKTGFSMFRDYKGHDMGAKIERDMRAKLFAHYQKLPFSFYDEQKTGQLMSRLTSDLLNLTELYHHGPENIAVYGTQFVGSLVILFGIHARLTLVICAFLPVMALYSLLFYGKLQTAYRVNQERIADINARAEENLSGIRTVQSCGAEAWEIACFARQNDRFYRSRARIYKAEALFYTVVDEFFTKLMTVAMIVTGGIWIARGTLAPADLLIFILYAAYLTEPVPKLAFMIRQYQEGLAGYRRFCEILAITPIIRDAPHAVELPHAAGRVTFDRVSFGYREQGAHVLSNICLEVAPGETVAIMGPSGVGKTTLCSLIARFYDVSGGDIRIDGVSIRDVTLASLRRQIGIVRQETFLFAGTVMENIVYGCPGATAEQAIQAARQANAHAFIMRLPQGYDTDIGQRGVRLSGGQRQRLSIARVFLQNPPIVIFDEATSALDDESESAVMQGLQTLRRGRTAFIIAHRHSTVQNADRVLTLTEDGLSEAVCAAGRCAANREK